MKLSLKPMQENDIPALADIHVGGWRASYDGVVSQPYLDGLKTEDFRAKWQEWLQKGVHTEIASTDEGIVGFVSFGKLNTPPPGQSNIRPQYTSEIYGLYVSPDYWRQGVGTMLLKQAATSLKDMKHASLCLWVPKDNARAISLYEKLGGKRIGKHDIRIGPSAVREVCYGWRDTGILL